MPLVLQITNLPTPYRLPLYRAMRAKLREGGEDLHIFFLGYAKSVRAWKVDEEDMYGLRWSSAEKGRPLRGAMRAIGELRPRAVILSWAMDLQALALLLRCRLRGIPCYVVSGETLRSASENRWRLLRQIFRQPFFHAAAGFITYGVRSTEYLLRSGVPADRITTGVNVADTPLFAGEVERLRENGPAAVGRERFRTPSGGEYRCHFLFVGYFLASKGIVQMIHAFRRLGLPDVALHIVGAGEQEREIRHEIARSGIGESIILHGYRQQAELPFYYALADVLLFPSLSEVYGLVMAEAAVSGLPIIASCHAGGVPEIVEDGVNGLVVDPGDPVEFAEAMGLLVDDPELRGRMADASRRRAVEYLTIGKSAAAYISAITGNHGDGR